MPGDAHIYPFSTILARFWDPLKTLRNGAPAPLRDFMVVTAADLVEVRSCNGIGP